MDTPGPILATYTDGVLKLDKPLDLPEGTRLRVVVSLLEPDPVTKANAIETLRRIRESGVFRSGGRKLTRDEMHERGE